MFRILKKWYFKIYHLFKFLGIFLLIFNLKNVYAEECTNLYPGSPGSLYYVSNAYYSSINSNSYLRFAIPGYLGYDNPAYLKLESKTYTFYALDENNELVQDLTFDTTMTILGKAYTTNTNLSSVIATPGQNGFSGNGIIFSTGSTSSEIYNTWQFWLVEGEEVCIPQPNIENDEIYSDFLTLYVDKINYLANGFTTKPYLKAMIGIIFAWIVLELLLKILNLRGGKRR